MTEHLTEPATPTVAPPSRRSPPPANAAPLALDEALSPTWLGRALDLPVHDVEIVETIRTVATKVRFRVTTVDGAVHALCIKGIFGDELSPGHARIARTEAGFYRDLAATADVAVPNCRYTGVDAGSGHGLIVMDDVVAAGGTFLTALEPYSPEQARTSLDQLAALHAAHWGGAGLGSTTWLRNRLADLAESPLRTVDELQELIDDPRGDLLAPEFRDAERITRALGALAGSTTGQVTALVHGDAHAGNLYVLDGVVSLIDWQLLQLSHWAVDVAYHVGAALSVEDRRSSEGELLDHYLDRLAARGVAAPDRAPAGTAAPGGVAYGYYLWSVTRRVDPPIIREFCTRLGTAVADLESFTLLGV